MPTGWVITIMIVGCLLYFFIGFAITLMSASARDNWHMRYNQSTIGSLLHAMVFPWTMGKEILYDTFSKGARRDWVPGMDPDDNLPESTYFVVSTFLWPLKFVVNLPGYVFFLTVLVIGIVTTKVREYRARRAGERAEGE